MNASPSIRRATVADAAAVAELGAATFVETFGHLYPPEDLHAYLPTAYTADVYRRRIEDPGTAIWVATIGAGAPIGFVLVGGCSLPVENLEPAAGELRQLYVLSQFHNLRLGTRLLETALDWLVTEGRAPLYVGVWSENLGAQRLYGRYGFKKVAEYGFPVGKTIDHEFILKR